MSSGLPFDMRRTAVGRSIVRYWGLLPLVAMFVLFGVARPEIGPYVVLPLMVLFWALFSAPTTCGAINRTRGGNEVEYCRNNSSGLLLGCRIRQHKWQRFKSAWWHSSWREKTRGLWTGASSKLATVSAIIGILTGLFGSCFDLVSNIWQLG